MRKITLNGVRSLFLLFALMICSPVLAQEAYAVFLDGTLTFYYDNQKASRNGMNVGPFSWSWDYDNNCEIINSEWFAYRKEITTVVFDDSFADCSSITSTAWWFYRCENLTTISGISNLNTQNVTRMENMFRSCNSLTSLDLSHFDTSNVTNMKNMFTECRKLTSLDVSHFDTQKVTTMEMMFYACGELTSLDISHFNTSNVTSMASMFSGCFKLTLLDVSHFDTKNVTTMNGMFFGCSGLTSLDVSHFETSNVIKMGGMFDSCRGLTSLDVSHFNTGKVTEMGSMFGGCSGLTSLDVSHFDTGNVTAMQGMFGSCSGLTTLDVSHFYTNNVTNMSGMFHGCVGLTSLDVSNFNTSNVTNMSLMFHECLNLKTIYGGDDWRTDKVTDSSWMFSGCNSLVGGSGTKFDADHVDASYAHIDGGKSNPGYFTRKGDAPPVSSSDDLQDFINGLGDNKGTEEEPIVVPTTPEGLIIDKEVNIDDDLQLFIDGGEAKEDKLPVRMATATICLNRKGASFFFENVAIQIYIVQTAPNVRLAAASGGFSNMGKLTFCNSTLNDGSCVIRNLAEATLVLKGNTVTSSGAEMIENSGDVLVDGTVSLGGLTNKKGGRIYVTSALTQDIYIDIVSVDDIETDLPIIAGGNGYSLTAEDASHIHLTLPQNYEWGYDSATGSIMVMDVTGITQATTAQPAVATTFDAAGRTVEQGSKGLTILRMSDGTTRKIYKHQ